MSRPSYPEYKESSVDWFRRIPRHWQEAKFRHVFDESGERIETHVVGAMLSVSGYRGIEVKEYDDDNRRRSDEDLVGYRIVRPGQLVVNTMWLNYAGLGVSDYEGHVSPAYRAYWISGEFDKRFVHYMMRSELFVRGYTKYLTGVRPNSLQMSREDLMQFPVLKPPYEEQSAIAAFLDRETAKIDVLIAEQELLLALLAEKRQAVISHATTKGINPDAPMRSSGVAWLEEVPAHWSVARVKTVCEFTTSGPRGWSERLTENGDLFIQSGDLNDRLGIEFETANRVAVGDDAESARTRLLEGDVVVCITGAKTGKVAVCYGLDEAAYVNQHLCLVRPNDSVDGRFMAFALASTAGQLQLEASQYGLKQGLSLEDVREVWIAFPKVEEQKAILNWLVRQIEEYSALVEESTRAVSLLRERRAAIIAAAITGQIDVREAA